MGRHKYEIQCSLTIKGRGKAPGIAFASMNCSGVGTSANSTLVQFGYNATQLQRVVVPSGGINSSNIQVKLVQNHPCQRAAEKGGYSALLFFCEPGVHLTLLQPRIVDVFWEPSKTIKSSLLAAAGGARVAYIDGSFERNTADSVLLVVGSARVTVQGLRADMNIGTLGAVAYVSNSGSLTILNSTLTGNAADNGAAISADSSASVTIKNSVITGSKASKWGGALAAAGSSRLLLHNCMVSGNEAKDGGGALSITATAQVSCNVTERNKRRWLVSRVRSVAHGGLPYTPCMAASPLCCSRHGMPCRTQE